METYNFYHVCKSIKTCKDYFSIRFVTDIVYDESLKMKPIDFISDYNKIDSIQNGKYSKRFLKFKKFDSITQEKKIRRITQSFNFKIILEYHDYIYAFINLSHKNKQSPKKDQKERTNFYSNLFKKQFEKNLKKAKQMKTIKSYGIELTNSKYGIVYSIWMDTCEPNEAESQLIKLTGHKLFDFEFQLEGKTITFNKAFLKIQTQIDKKEKLELIFNLKK